MYGLRRCFGLQPKPMQPSEAETDDVFPVYSSDDTLLYKKIMLNWTLRFDDVLDVDILQDSLTRLLQTGNWRKLGGRLRLDRDGKLVLHVPKQFTSERPAVSFSHQVLNMFLEDHPLASQLPKATGGQPSKHPGPRTFRSFGMRPDAPACLDDLLRRDEPQLSVHVTSFKDATLVGILWPHTMTGAMGLSALMKAWSLTLSGRENEVPELHGVWVDVLSEASERSEPDAEPYVLAGKELKGYKLLRFGLHFFRSIYCRPKRDLQVFYLPASLVAKWRQRGIDDLKTPKKSPFISEGDTLAAWATLIVTKQQGTHLPMLVLNSFDAQSRLKSVFDPEAAYVQNTAFGCISTFPPGEASTVTFGQVARKFREDLSQQSTEQQILAQARFTKAAEKRSIPAAFGETNTLLLMVTNWTKANLYEAVDFSSAVVDTGVSMGKSEIPPGKMVYHHSEAITQNPTAANIFVVLGKDQEGNYWVASTFLSKSWAEVEKMVKKYA